ncbi:MAG: anaerobic ribonucleoside-triphosphate reductase activating protein [Candidatus Cloacimonetes bacterium]|nr:anaerobic ribonucleoside-triphosphate reductase activating protein [Candidatus Cloacimonadota bacterium]
MLIGGLQKFSLLDYPSKICAIVFTQGCNFKCPYCHNPELVNPSLFREPIPTGYVLDFLEQRKGKLDALVVTGGEPTLQQDLPRFLVRIKKMGYAVKVDTNGSNPEMLARLIKRKLVDYLAMDIKAPSDKYHIIAGTAVDIDRIAASVAIIKKSGIEYEFRSTLVQNLISLEEAVRIGGLIGVADRFYLQHFEADRTLSAEYREALPFTCEQYNRLAAILSKNIREIHLR